MVVTSRSAAGARQAVAQLREEVGQGASIAGATCDVSDAASVDALVAEASALLGGRIDVWINNAGASGSFQACAPARRSLLLPSQAPGATGACGASTASCAGLPAATRQ